MKALATIGTGPMRPVLARALPSMEAYAARFGYDLVIGAGDSEGRHPSWGKVRLLQRLLAGYDSVLWLDSDVLVLDWSDDLLEHLPGDAFQGFVRTAGADGELAPNLGVWILRDTPAAHNFLSQVWTNPHALNSHGMWENLAVLDLLGYTTERPYRKVHESAWDSGTSFLAEEWNTMVSGAAIPRGLRFAHFSAMPNDKRVLLMRMASLRRQWEQGPALDRAKSAMEWAGRRLELSLYARRRAVRDRKAYFEDRYRDEPAPPSPSS